MYPRNQTARRRSSSGRNRVTRPRSTLIKPRVAKRLRARLTFSRLAPTRPASVRCDSGAAISVPNPAGSPKGLDLAPQGPTLLLAPLVRG